MQLYMIAAELQDKVNRINEMVVLEDGRLLDEETGEIMEADVLDRLQMDFDDKVKNCLYQIKNYELDESALDGKIDYLKKALEDAKKEKESVTKRKEWLKRYTASFLENKKWSDKDKKVSCSFRTIYSTGVLELDKVPAEYKKASAQFDADAKEVIEALKNAGVDCKYEAKKAEALKDLKAGKKIEGLELKQTYSMTVK